MPTSTTEHAPLADLRTAYEALKGRGLKLDLTRGKPAPAQLDLSNPMLDLPLSADHTSAGGVDVRNYGGADGLPELRAIFGELLGIPVDQLLALGNASLNVMHDVIVHALLHGVPGNTVPWRDDEIAFLCPVPGYDRHFAITESFGIKMIPLPYLEGGALDLTAIGEHLKDPSVRGMWLVPMYGNPSGNTVTEAEAKALVSTACGRPGLPDLLGQRICGPPPDLE